MSGKPGKIKARAINLRFTVQSTENMKLGYMICLYVMTYTHTLT